MRSLALVALLLLVPAAQAFEFQASMDSSEPIEPDTEIATGTLRMSVSCQEIFDAYPSPMEQPVVSIDVASPHSELAIAMANTHPVPRDHCVGPATQGDVSFDVPFNVTGSMRVPGETPFLIEFTTTFGDLEPQTRGVTVTMAYFGLIQVEVLESTKQAGPQKEIPFEVRITNLGNSRTVLKFAGDSPAKGQLVLPDQAILDSAAHGTGHDSIVVTVIYATPFENGPNQAQETLNLTVTPHSTKSPVDAGAPVEFDLTGRTKGVYVPGPGAILLPAILGAALLRRRA